MKQFTDNQKRVWDVTINVNVLKRIRDVLDLDLTRVVEDELIARLSNDPILLVDTLYVVCRTQADKCIVSDEDFGGSIGGDVIEEATIALLEELCDFFPKLRRRTLRKILAKVRTLADQAGTRAGTILDSDKLDRMMARQLDEAEADLDRELAGTSSTTAPESSASTPAP